MLHNAVHSPNGVEKADELTWYPTAPPVTVFVEILSQGWLFGQTDWTLWTYSWGLGRICHRPHQNIVRKGHPPQLEDFLSRGSGNLGLRNSQKSRHRPLVCFVAFRSQGGGLGLGNPDHRRNLVVHRWFPSQRSGGLIPEGARGAAVTAAIIRDWVPLRVRMQRESPQELQCSLLGHPS